MCGARLILVNMNSQRLIGLVVHGMARVLYMTKNGTVPNIIYSDALYESVSAAPIEILVK